MYLFVTKRDCQRKHILFSTGHESDLIRSVLKRYPVMICLVLVFLIGCSTPIGTRPEKISHTYEQINRNATRIDGYSDLSAQVLHRFFLEDLFRKAPDEAIAALHDIACKDNRRELLYTLSELTYLTAGQTGNSKGASQRAASYYMASAVYAYFYLFSQGGFDSADLYDRRLRFACDLYNAALAQILSIHKNNWIELTGIQELPLGSIALELRRDHFSYELENIETLVPADKVSVYGLSVRDRLPGLGAPFIAVEKQIADRPVDRSFPGTLFLRVDGDIRNLKTGGKGQIELYSSYEKRTVTVNDKTVPLEKDLSAQLAYSLNQPFFWEMGRLQFMRGAIVKSGIYPLQPYAPGRIPVVFVHGTFSSPVWWAEMINTLRSDTKLWDKYQFWCYLYDSGKPTVLSATHLRSELSRMINKSDPEGKDRALSEMVVVGHSQGGLLTKLTAVETGDSLIRSATGKPIDELNLDAEQLEIIKKYLIYSPLPFVQRVVFISTPHRGSYLSKGWVRNLLQRIIHLPVNLMKKTKSLITIADEIGVSGLFEVDDLATSLDSMSPENPGLLTLAEIPLAPGIKGHSIIAIDGDEEPPEGGDGVVKYTSAHIDYADSEFIVREGHSCQSHSLVIEEVRRILIEHIQWDENKN